MNTSQKEELNRLFEERLPIKLKQVARSLQLLADNGWPQESLQTFSGLIDRICRSCHNFRHEEAEHATRDVGNIIGEIIQHKAYPKEDEVKSKITRLLTIATPQKEVPAAKESSPVDTPHSAEATLPTTQTISPPTLDEHSPKSALPLSKTQETLSSNNVAERAPSLTEIVATPQQSVESATTPAPVEEAPEVTLIVNPQPQGQELQADEAKVSEILHDEPLYFLLGDLEADKLNELMEQSPYFGYQCQLFASTLEVSNACKAQQPAAIVLYFNGEKPEEAFRQTIDEIQAQNESRLPVLTLSGVDNLEARLTSVRAGSNGFFPMPVEISHFIELLDELAIPSQENPYRLLIMEDSKAQAKYFSRIFTAAGIEVKAVHHPKDISAALVEFNPELIIMDMLMPVCSGIELAQVIKQQPNVKNIPIVYLSANNDALDKLEQLTVAGEDFLTKSIRSEQLLDAIQLRLRRARHQARQSVSHPLTGLFTSDHFYSQLKIYLVKLKRDDQKGSLAIINIDGLQGLNDAQGYAAGNRVIKSLAKQLKQRVRFTDLMGHYNQSDFAIFFADCDKASAKAIMQQLDADYSSVIHTHQDQSFSVSFCCGIAETSTDDMTTLKLQAEKALNLAKSQGQSSIVVT
ncbi:MAG: response regulator [Pseudomonadota bacterium]